jgi:uncharacterized iron-regulated protein
MVLLTIAFMAAIGVLLTGCAVPRYLDAHDPSALTAPAAYDMGQPRRLPMFTGAGRAMNWSDLQRAIDWAEIVIIGEQHDDAMGHAFQLVVMEDTLARWPRAMLSMEMLERDHQLLVDDYLEELITQEFFVQRAGIARWGGRDGAWNDWYQPIVDAAKDAGTRVIAANAPRRYVRQARLRGYPFLRTLPADRRALFTIPPRLPRNHYHDRFYEVMLAMRDHGDGDEVVDDFDAGEGDGEGESEREHSRPPTPDAGIDAMYRSQMLWDATMAASIIRARPSRDRKVVHLVGRFHSDFEGGTVLELRRHRPAVRIVTISMSPQDAEALQDSDLGRADIIVYTGEQFGQPEIDENDTDDLDDDESESSH